MFEQNKTSESEVLFKLLNYSNPNRNNNSESNKLLSEFKSLNKIMNSDLDSEDMKIFQLVKDSIKFYLKPTHFIEDRIFSEMDMLDYLIARLGFEERSSFLVILLDKNKKIIKDEIRNAGDTSNHNFYLRDIAKFALENNATFIVLASNNPSGEKNVSLLLTENFCQMKKSLREIDIFALDQYVILNDSIFSIAKNEKILDRVKL